MADKIPLKAIFDDETGDDVVALGEFGTGDTIPVDQGGTGATTASDARSNLGLGIDDTPTFSGADLDGAVVINQSGADVDFRVESDTDANALFVEGSSGNVGIGTSTPNGSLDIRGDSDFDPEVNGGIDGRGVINAVSDIDTNNGADAEPSITFKAPFVTNDSQQRRIVYAAISGIKQSDTTGFKQGALKFYTNTGGSVTEQMRIISVGYVGIGTTNPLRHLHISDSMRLEPRAYAPGEDPQRAGEPNPSAGDIYFDSSETTIKYYDGSTWQSLAANSGLSFDAGSISYSNTSSGLAATDVQAAIDEIESRAVQDTSGNILLIKDSTGTVVWGN